ncbi:unnamed protein product, partial [marine sediment metagenome]
MDITTPKQKVDWKSYKLTSRQAKFVNLLVSDPTMAQGTAYKKIFSTKSDASARSGASNMLRRINVREYKEALEAKA